MKYLALMSFALILGCSGKEPEREPDSLAAHRLQLVAAADCLDAGRVRLPSGEYAFHCRYSERGTHAIFNLVADNEQKLKRIEVQMNGLDTRADDKAASYYKAAEYLATHYIEGSRDDIMASLIDCEKKIVFPRNDTPAERYRTEGKCGRASDREDNYGSVQLTISPVAKAIVAKRM